MCHYCNTLRRMTDITLSGTSITIPMDGPHGPHMQRMTRSVKGSVDVVFQHASTDHLNFPTKDLHRNYFWIACGLPDGVDHVLGDVMGDDQGLTGSGLLEHLNSFVPSVRRGRNIVTPQGSGLIMDRPTLVRQNAHNPDQINFELGVLVVRGSDGEEVEVDEQLWQQLKYGDI